jgi:Papain-like cysteine protease AvrRpt2
MSESKQFRIPLQHQQQQESYDCWATCLAMICQWKGVGLSRAQIWSQGHVRFPELTRETGMLAIAQSIRLIKEMTGGKITFTEIAGGGAAGRGKVIITWEVYKSYLNQFRPILITMHRHCWIISGYNDATQRILVHNVAKSTGPDEAGVLTLNNNTIERAILDIPMPKPFPMSDVD